MSRNIGILIQKFESLFSNGIAQQSYFSYKVIKNAGYNVNFYSNQPEYTTYEYLNIPIYLINESTLKDLDVLICIGSSFNKKEDIEYVKSFNVKLINQICGNEFIITQEDTIFNVHNRNFYLNREYYDEIWVLPMYKHMIEYTEVLSKQKVKVAPYIWDSTIIDIYSSLYNKNIYFNYDKKIFNDKLNILIAEPNVSIHKTCLIPLVISEDY